MNAAVWPSCRMTRGTGRIPGTKRDKIISAVNARVKQTTHKCGVAIHRSADEASALDTKMATPSSEMH